MAPLPANTTPRFWLDYNDGIYDHSFLVRYNAVDNSLAEVMGSVDSLLTAIADSMYEVTITGARWSAAGSNISTPTTWTGSASYGGGAMPAVFAPRQMCFLGRDGSGVRYRLFLFGMEFDTPNNYRIARVAANVVDDALTVIEGAQTSGIYLTIEGGAPVMYQYADINFNNYYEAKVRG